MTTDTHDSNKSTGADSTNTTLAETVGVVRGSLERLEDVQDDRDCRGAVDETGYYVLEDPSNDNAWVRTQDIAEVRC